jgi:hypothetical protein
MYKLWTDKENRTIEGTSRLVWSSPAESKSAGHGQSNGRRDEHEQPIRLRIEPLHQVHDALVGQFKKADTAWSVGKINEWFDNPLYIAGQRIVIPFDGGYGASWAQAGDEEKREGKI